MVMAAAAILPRRTALRRTSSFSCVVRHKNSPPSLTFDRTTTWVSSLAASSSSSSNAANDADKAVPLAPRLEGLDRSTVWHEFSPLSVEYGSINLGQGFPDWDPPSFCAQALQQSVARGANQDTRSHAHWPLAQVLAEDYTRRWKIALHPETEVATAVGCSNALYCALQGLLSPQHQVILLEPAFDMYMAQVRLTGAQPVFVPLRPSSSAFGKDDDTEKTANDAFFVDWDELEAAITPQTRVLILNTPHNPTGKVFSRQELQCLADIVDRHPQLVVITDEVYEHIVFDIEASPHISFATLPGMFERTLTLSSSGKTFSATGWKVGWAVGPPSLVRAVTLVQQYVNFSVPTPNQDAIAQCLQVAQEPFENHDTYYDYVAAEYLRKRDFMASALRQAQLSPVLPLGGFFVLADTTRIAVPKGLEEEAQQVTAAMPTNPMPRDWALSRWMTKHVGVTAIPPSAFYQAEHVHLAQGLLRFVFCKQDEVLQQAQERLQAYFGMTGE